MHRSCKVLKFCMLHSKLVSTTFLARTLPGAGKRSKSPANVVIKCATSCDSANRVPAESAFVHNSVVVCGLFL